MTSESAACVAISSGVLLIAQTVDPISVFPQWLQVGGAGAAVAGMIWFMYYTTAVIHPQMQDKHTATVEKIVDRFGTELSAERVHHAETCKQIVDGIDRHISRLECQQTRSSKP